MNVEIIDNKVKVKFLENGIIPFSFKGQFNIVFIRPMDAVRNVEMNFYYRKQQLRADLLNDFSPDWETIDPNQLSYIANKPLYKGPNSEVIIEDDYKEALTNLIKNVHAAEGSKATLLERQVSTLMEQNAIFAKYLNTLEAFNKQFTEENAGLKFGSDQKVPMENGVDTNIIGILPVLQQMINEIKYLYDLVVSKTEVIISSERPGVDKAGKLWINTDQNSGNGLLYYRNKDALGNEQWTPLSALWTSSGN